MERTAAQRTIDAEAPALREHLARMGHMTKWPHNDQVQAGYPPSHVQQYCVNHKPWQAVRLSMKGKPTHEKLSILKAYWDKPEHHSVAGVPTVLYVVEIQVGNYLGALRRGGQLDEQNQVRKYL